MRRLSTARAIIDEHDGRKGFTLVELLVVIAIVLILTAVTVASFNFSVNADRMRAGARQMQSILAGARDKAIYAKEIRGVRLLLDPDNNHAVSAVQYIGSPQRETGVLTFNTGDPTGKSVALSGSLWPSLYKRGFLRVGTQIQIPRESGTWYTVSGIGLTSGTFNGTLTLNRPNRDLAGSLAGIQFVLELAPSVLGDAQPIPFPRGVVIDLDGSQIPSNWFPISAASPYSAQMDILFTPRGTVVGDVATLGMLHLHFADATDVLNWNDISAGIAGRRVGSYSRTSASPTPIVPADNSNSISAIVKRDRILLTVSARTGNVSVHQVFPKNIDGDSRADDPFFFAETGQVASK